MRTAVTIAGDANGWPTWLLVGIGVLIVLGIVWFIRHI